MACSSQVSTPTGFWLGSGTTAGTGDLEDVGIGKKSEWEEARVPLLFPLPCCRQCHVLAKTSSLPWLKLPLDGYIMALDSASSLSPGV